MIRLASRFVAFALLALAVTLPFIGCKPKPTAHPWGESGTVKVAVSFPALYCFAANVVGDTGTVKSIKSTQGAHGSEVTNAERELVDSADVLFLNGLGLDEKFGEKLRSTSANKNLKVVALGKTLPHKLLIEAGECSCCKHENEGEGIADEHDHDPHAWLGTKQAIRYVETIARQLGEIYPQHHDTFIRNAAAYIEKLKALQAEGEEKLKGSKAEDRKLVTVHGSMGYFADSYKMEIAGVVQTTPGQEPTPKQLADLIKKCQKEGARVIAAEPQFSKLGAVNTLKQALAQAGVANAAVIELDPLETATPEELTADWYERKIRANFEAVAKVFAP